MPRTLLIILFFLASAVTISGQDNPQANGIGKAWKINTLQLAYQNGYVFATNDFLKGVNLESEKINGFQNLSVKLSNQTDGKKLWEQLYLYPEWGIGIYIADFYNPEEIGRPFALFGFLNAPFIRGDRLLFNYELGFGATFNWKSFNPVTNQYNIAIGAGESFIIDAGLNLQYTLSKKVAIAGGVSLTHFSNGALKKPNFGINTIAPKIAVKYDFSRPEKLRRIEVPKFHPHNEWLLATYAGVKNVIFDSVNINVYERYEGVFYPVFGLSGGFNRVVGYKSKFGIGMTFSYDGSVNAQVAVDENELEPVDTPLAEKFQISIYPSYELVLNRISLLLQPAFYLYRRSFKNQTPSFHQRIGLKYQITDHLSAGIILRDYAFHVSDHIEWTLGYRFKEH